MKEAETSSALGTMFLWALGVVLLLAGILAAFYFTSFDTQYAPGYSEKAFKSIKLGDTEQQVLSLISAPFSTDVNEPYIAWIYSADRQTHFSTDGEGSGTYTTVRFNAVGQMASISGQRQMSVNTFTFGDGLGYLSLTKEQIERLKGSTQDEIRQKLGSPKAVYEFKASKVLHYSRSPSSSHYHFRALGLDNDGKVVKIWREIYWD